MKAKEIIEELQKYDEEEDVCVCMNNKVSIVKSVRYLNHGWATKNYLAIVDREE